MTCKNLANRNEARRQTAKRARMILSLIAGSMIAPSLAGAQTSGTWVPVKNFVSNTNGLWYDPTNWSGGIPNNGGTATFLTAIPQIQTAPSQVPDIRIPTSYPDFVLGGVVSANLLLPLTAVKLESNSTTLSGITQTSGVNVGITGTASSSIVIAPGGATFNVAPAPTATGAAYINGDFGLVIYTPITGGALTKTGQGVLAFNSWRSQMSSLIINQGTVSVSGANSGAGSSTNAFFKDSNRTITMNGATLRFTTGDNYVSAGLTSTLTQSLNPIGLFGTNTIEASTNVSIEGSLTGTGSLIKSGSANATFLVGRGVSTFTGPVSVRDGSLTLGGSTSGNILPNVTSYDLSGSLIATYKSYIIIPNRIPQGNAISPNAPITLRGGDLAIVGRASTDIVQNVLSVTADVGISRIAINNLGTSTTLNIGSLSRSANRGVIFIRGDLAGPTPINVNTPVGFVGNQSGTGTQVPVIPWVTFQFGSGFNSDGSALIDSFSSVQLVTQVGTQLLPLGTTNYTNTLSSSTGTQNVNLSSGLTFATPTAASANALVLGGSLAGAGSSVTVNSGVILTSGNPTISVPINFGSAEGVLYPVGGLTISAPISGSNGLTKGISGTQGNLILTGAASQSTYTGPTTILGGVIRFAGDVGTGASSFFGAGNSPVVLAPGADFNQGGLLPQAAALSAAASLTFSKPINVVGQGRGRAIIQVEYLGGETNTSYNNISFTLNGPISLDRTLSFSSDSSKNQSITVNGVISGSGKITDVAPDSNNGFGAGGRLTFANNNSFSGGVDMYAATFVVGADNALGTGPISVYSATVNGSRVGPTIEVSGPARTLANGINLYRTLVINGGDVTFNGPITLGNLYNYDPLDGVTFTLNNNNTTFAGPISSGGLSKLGTGNLFLTNSNNTFFAPLFVGDGSASIGNGGTTGNIIADVELSPNATFYLNRSNNFTLVSSVTGTQQSTNIDTTPTGTLVKLGAGTATLTGSYINPETLLVSGGTVRIGDNTSLPKFRTNDLIADSGSAVFGAASSPGSYSYLGSVKKITVSDGQTVQISPRNAITDKAKLLKTDRVPDLGSTGFLDLTNNDLIIKDAADSVDQIRALVKRWNDNRAAKSGLGSSVANAYQTLAVFPNRFYYVDGSLQQYFIDYDGFTNSSTTLEQNDVIVKFTWVGDVDLDGVVDGADGKIILETIFNNGTYMDPQNSGWFTGDIDYSGIVDFADYALWDAARIASGGASLGNGQDLGGGTSSIPEPSSVVMGVAGLGLLSRRRRA